MRRVIDILSLVMAPVWGVIVVRELWPIDMVSAFMTGMAYVGYFLWILEGVFDHAGEVE